MDNLNEYIWLVAGPCAAESEEQVLSAARAIKSLMPTLQSKVHRPILPVFRAGLWKPRTSPHSFQGVGENGLGWLQEVQKQMRLPAATEVATAEQARLAIDAGLEAVWIGARTSANPQQVQQIADALKERKGQLQAVMVKNPMHEDAGLWQGNIERMQGLGVPVWAVHRGCNHRPCWQIPYRLHQLMPDVPLLLDPSHLSGNARHVPSLCHTAARLGYNGWMIEVHPTPREAWSDPQQQILPQQLTQCVTPLQPYRELDWLRQQMDEVDDDLWQTILRRMEVSRQIGSFKQQTGMEIVQPERFLSILRQRLQWANENGINEDTVRNIMDALHTESIRRQHPN